MTSTSGLPQISEAQKIGFEAERVLLAKQPRNWLPPKSLAGTDDFGMDFQAQLFEGTSATDLFRIQLKGTTKPYMHADGNTLSISLSMSTLRYYDRVTEPILLVLCDLSDPDDEADHPLYYVWIHDQLRERKLRDVPDEQQELTLHVPKANGLNRKTDLSVEVRLASQLGKVGRELYGVVHGNKPGLDPVQLVEMITGMPSWLAKQSGTFIDFMALTTTSPWPNPTAGTLPWHLAEAIQALRLGDGDKCLKCLQSAELMLAGASELEQAEFWFQTGRLHSLGGQEQGARDAFFKSAQTSSLAKYVAAWAESELVLRFHLDKPVDFSDIYPNLTGDEPDILGVKARLLAAEGRYEDSHKVIESMSGVERFAAKAIVHTMQSEPNLVLAACNEGLALPNLLDSKRQLFTIMKARSRFNLAIASSPLPATGEYLPPSGLPGTDVAMLALAWSDIQNAVQLLQSSGWPTNVEFLADIWGATCSMLGKQEDTLPTLAAAGKARPHCQVLQTAVEAVALQSSEFALALQANSNIQNDGAPLRRIALLHVAKHDRECIALFEAKLAELSTAHPFYGEALCMAILSAERLVRSDLVNLWLSLLDSNPENAARRATLDYFLAVGRNTLKCDEALADLETRYEELGHPTIVGLHLFHELDPSDPEQSQRCIAVAGRLSGDRMLHLEGVIHLAMALVTREDWSGLLDCVSDALQRFQGNIRLQSLQALALDNLGRSAEAHEQLRRMLEQGINDQLAFRTYVNIVMRCGFVDDAIAVAEKMQAIAKSKQHRIEALRILCGLVQVADPKSGRAIDIAMRLGDIVDQNVEDEEGLFLILLLTSTMRADTDPIGARRPEINARYEAFFNNFPNSTALKRGNISDKSSPEEMLKEIQRIAGVSEEQTKFRIKLENQLERDQVPVPFAWRPKLALGMVHDVVQLWEIAKRSKADDHKFHLTMALDNWKARSVQELRARVPLLDLTSLLVAFDLKILNRIFDFYPRIAISKQTLVELASFTHPMSGCGWRSKCLDLQDALKRRMNQILQPHAIHDEMETNSGVGQASAEIKAICDKGEYELYSDDAIFRIFCAGEDAPQGICSLDILHALESERILTTREVAEKIATLCEWHVGLLVNLNHQRAILPETLNTVQSVSAGVDLLQASHSFLAIFNGIWDARKTYGNILEPAAALLRRILDDQTLAPTAIAALAGFWYFKSKLKSDTPTPPLYGACGLVAMAAMLGSDLEEHQARRLWFTFMALVELEHGDRMDIQREKEGIAMLGKFIASVDAELPAGKSTLKAQLSQSLQAGTANADAFSDAYTRELVNVCSKAATKKVGK